MRLACVTALAALAFPLQAQPINVFETESHAQAVDETSQAEDVRLRKDANDRLTVPVRLAGAGPFRFLVDTGSNRTSISSAIAARLGLEAGERTDLHTVAGVSNVRTAIIPNLQLSNDGSRVIDAPILEAQHMGADGILGTDLLGSKRVILDFEKRLMTIVPSEQREPKEQGTIVVTGRLRNGRLVVTNAVADGSHVTVVLDTGSEVSVGNEALRRRLGRDGLLKDTGTIELISVTGEILHGQYTSVRELQIGGAKFDKLGIVFADVHTFKQLGLNDRPALLLGMNALRAFKKVSIDFANKKVRLVLPETGSLDSFLLATR